MVSPSHLRPCLLAALMVALAVRAEAVAAAVFGVDDRQSLSGDRSELAGIAMVSETRVGAYGTAFLVAPCLALSARHMVHRADPVGQRLTLRFAPWHQADRSNSSAAMVIAAGGAASSAGDVSQDWVLLRLDRCLGATLGYFPLSREALRIPPSGPIAPALVAVGFPEDRATARRPVIDPDCRVRMIASTGLLHDCATMPGNSGGPMMAWSFEHQRYEVYAINVAGFADRAPRAFDQASANGAVAVGPIIVILDAIEAHGNGATKVAH